MSEIEKLKKWLNKKNIKYEENGNKLNVFINKQYGYCYLKVNDKGLIDASDLPYSEYEKGYTANDCKKCIKLILNLETSFDAIDSNNKKIIDIKTYNKSDINEENYKKQLFVYKQIINGE